MAPTPNTTTPARSGGALSSALELLDPVERRRLHADLRRMSHLRHRSEAALSRYALG